jgi:hypothetical protein
MKRTHRFLSFHSQQSAFFALQTELDKGTFKGPMTTLVIAESNHQWPNDD